MFEAERSLPEGRRRTWVTLVVSVAAHVAILLLVVSATFAATTGTTPTPSHILAYVTPAPPPPPPAPAPLRHPTAAHAQPVTPVAPAPVVAPSKVTAEPVTPPPPSLASIGGVEGGVSGGVAGGVVGGTGAVVGIAPPPPPPAAVRIGGDIKAPALVRQVAPVYPAAARMARVQGNVTVEAHVEADGQVQSVHVVKSVPLLDRAAVTAVKQWQYSPLLLNGTPTPFVLTVTVSFNLG